MATPILEIPEVSTSILSFALLNIVLRHYEQAASNRIIDSLATPPAAPADGDAYFILGGATGLWNGREGDIAFSISGAWYFMKAIPQIPYLKTSTNTLVTLDSVTATEGVFSSGGGGGGGGSAGLTVQDEGTTLGSALTVTTLNFVGSGVTATRSANTVSVSVPGGGGGGGATYYNVTATSGGTVSIPWHTYPSHSVVFVDCSAVNANFIGLNINIDLLTGSTGGKKIEIIFHSAPSNVMYVYNAGSFGSYTLQANDTIYRSNNLFFITYEVNFTTSNVVVHNASRPDDAFNDNNNTSFNPDEITIQGLDKRGHYIYHGAFLSAGGATLTLTWDDAYIQDVYDNLHWSIVIHDLPPVVTSVVVADVLATGTTLIGILSKTPINGTVAFEWRFTTDLGGWIIS